MKNNETVHFIMNYLESWKNAMSQAEVSLYKEGKDNAGMKWTEFHMKFILYPLVHILLHPWSENIEELSKQEFKDRESQANKFAGAFLLPQESFGNDASHYPTKLDFYIHLKNKWNVSIQAMIHRAHQLDIITTSQYQYLMRQISKRGWRIKEPDDKPYKMNKTLLQEAIELLFSSEEMTPSEFMFALRKKGLVLRHEDVEDLLA